MGKPTTIHSFFKRKQVESSNVNEQTSIPTSFVPDERPPKSQRNEDINTIDIGSLERDPGCRQPIWKYPPNQQDEIRRAYITLGPYHGNAKFPLSQYGTTDHARRFQDSWFSRYPSWLEYSPSKDAAFCLSCYLFNSPTQKDTFTHEGFRHWKKVGGKQCPFLKHEGNSPTSLHRNSSQKCLILMSPHQHLEKVLSQQSAQQIANNRLRLTASIFSVRWLAFQSCALRGNDESVGSLNRGNFIEMLKGLSHFSKEVANVVLDKAPGNASYTSPDIQKEILLCLSNQVKRAIREEIGDSKYSILVDESRDNSRREQMALVLRFVDQNGLVKERFFGVTHVPDTTSPTLKNAIYSMLSKHDLSIQNIRGQGYDGANNMSGDRSGVQTLISKDCPSAYYVHCMAHRLQLSLVASSKEVNSVYHFFDDLSFIINIPLVSCKRSDQLRMAKASEIEYLVQNDTLQTGTGLNQIGSLQRPGDTRWSSHLKAVSSLLKFFSPTCEVLINLHEDAPKPCTRAEAEKAYELLTSFQFVFLLHFIKEVFEITDLLCQALQCKSQDIVNAMHLVATTKACLEEFKENGWNSLFDKVKAFCEIRNIDVPAMDAQYVRGIPSRHNTNRPQVTIEHHYKECIFSATIDSQIKELNKKFDEKSVDLLVLSCALDPKDGYSSFNLDDICKLASEYYPEDFSEIDQHDLRRQLEHYKLDIPHRLEFENLSSIPELCQTLVKTRKSKIYPLVDRLLRLILTLPVSTASPERAFSAMNITKTVLRNKMEDDYLSSYLVVHIEREIAESFSLESTVKEFASLKERRSQFF